MTMIPSTLTYIDANDVPQTVHPHIEPSGRVWPLIPAVIDQLPYEQVVAELAWYRAPARALSPSDLRTKQLLVERLEAICPVCRGHGWTIETGQTWGDGCWMPDYEEIDCDHCAGTGCRPLAPIASPAADDAAIAS